MKEIEMKVKSLIVDQLGVKEEQVMRDGVLVLEAEFIKDLGADSLDIVEFVMKLEEEFGIEIADEVAEKMRTVGDVVKHIEEAKGVTV